jgi:galactokinase
MNIAAGLAQRFRDLYGTEPRVYRAPGRVNLIGEHTDYTQGLVMPMAIDAAVWVAIAPRDDRKVVLRSENFSETVEFSLEETTPERRQHWSDYPRGVAYLLARAGHELSGANMLLVGEVPVGSGLSSSAAIEVATGFALLECAGINVDRLQLALTCQRAENEFVEMRCGLMDQFVSTFAQEDHALMLDCRSLEYQTPRLPAAAKVVVCNTMVKHELAASEYNVRRAECEEGVRLLAEELPLVRTLRDVKLSDLDVFKAKLPHVVLKRCRHVVSENARVTAAADALERGYLGVFGKLMNESHQSLRDDFEVSCEELDVMVELAQPQEGVFGARMTGGGFGGCTVNLVELEAVDAFKQNISARYEKRTGLVPDIFVCSAAPGAQRVM